MQIYAGLMNGHSLTDCVAPANIQFGRLEDHKWSNHPQIHRFDAPVRSYIWRKLRGIEFRSLIVSELADRPNTRRELGYGTFNGKRRCPHQTNFNEALNDRFGPDLREFIDDVVALVREWAYDNDLLIETTELLVPDKRDETQELTRGQIRRIVNEMVGYITPKYSFGRKGGISHDQNIFFQLLAHCALTSSSVPGGDTFEWQQINNDPSHGRTFMDLVKAMPKDHMVVDVQQRRGLHLRGVQEADRPVPGARAAGHRHDDHRVRRRVEARQHQVDNRPREQRLEEAQAGRHLRLHRGVRDTVSRR